MRQDSVLLPQRWHTEGTRVVEQALSLSLFPWRSRARPEKSSPKSLNRAEQVRRVRLCTQQAASRSPKNRFIAAQARSDHSGWIASRYTPRRVHGLITRVLRKSGQRRGKVIAIRRALAVGPMLSVAGPRRSTMARRRCPVSPAARGRRRPVRPPGIWRFRVVDIRSRQPCPSCADRGLGVRYRRVPTAAPQVVGENGRTFALPCMRESSEGDLRGHPRPDR